MKLINGTKAQASIEYLVTYGWAILMITIVGLLMWQMGVLKLPNPPPDCRGFAKIRPMDWAFYSDPILADSDFTLAIINEAGTRLRIPISGVRVSIEGRTECTGYEPDSETNISSGEKIQVNLSSCPSMGAGDYYIAHINITYTNIASGMTHTSVGKCWGDAQ
jgi:hypothetical protein